MRMIVFCKTTFEGIHCWDNIPSTEKAQFLKYPHRHIFHITVGVKVNHHDRDIEIINLKHKVNEYLAHIFPDKEYDIPYMGRCSCEMLADQLLKEFEAEYVSVSEDGENGAILMRSDSEDIIKTVIDATL